MKAASNLLLLAVLVGAANAQVGISTCGCAPSTYELTLDFQSTCDNNTITTDTPGVEGVECFVRQTEDNQDEVITDFVPELVSTIDVLELNRSFVSLRQSFYEEGYRSGSTIEYTSIVQIDPNLSEADVPAYLQVNIVGSNAEGQAITNVWIVEFTNECGVFPVIEIGDVIGWTIFSNLTSQSSVYCPAEPPVESDTPSDVPSLAPIVGTVAPVVPATAAPVTPETEAPVVPATVVPGTTAAPTAVSAPTCPPLLSKGSKKSKGGKKTGGKGGKKTGGSSTKHGMSMSIYYDLGDERDLESLFLDRTLKVGGHKSMSVEYTAKASDKMSMHYSAKSKSKLSKGTKAPKSSKAKKAKKSKSSSECPELPKKKEKSPSKKAKKSKLHAPKASKKPSSAKMSMSMDMGGVVDDDATMPPKEPPVMSMSMTHKKDGKAGKKGAARRLRRALEMLQA